MTSSFASIGTASNLYRDNIKEFNDYIMSGARDPVLTVEPVINYLVKAPGKPVGFADGKVVYMNRATRRRNKIR